MNITIITQLILDRLPILREQLMRRFNNPDLIEESFSVATEVLISKPHLWKEEKGKFNTYLFNITKNWCQEESMRLAKQVPLDAPEVEIDNYYDLAIFDGGGYDEFVMKRFPYLQAELTVSEDNEFNPHAETQLFATMQAIVPDIDLWALYHVEEASEGLDLSFRQRWLLKRKVVKRITKVLEGTELVSQWRRQLMVGVGEGAAKFMKPKEFYSRLDITMAKMALDE